MSKNKVIFPLKQSTGSAKGDSEMKKKALLFQGYLRLSFVFFFDVGGICLKT